MIIVDKLLKMLDFCGLLDYDKRLSITNISLIVLITKLVATSHPDFATIGVTAVGFLNYMHKRTENNKAPDKDAQV